MPHIKLPQNVPGIRSLVMFRPDTGEHLYHLVQVLLHGSSSSLQAAEKELIAAYVSNRNGCMFCTNSHAAAYAYAVSMRRGKRCYRRTLETAPGKNR